MRDPDALALYDALPPDERAALDAALREHPALAEAFARWRSLRAGVRRELARDLPDRTLLVLYALADDDLLSDAEREQLEAARPALDDALARHPGLVAAVQRIRADRDAFEAAWTEAASEPGTGDRGPAVVSTVADRSPRRPERAATRAADRPTVRRVARPTRWIARVAAVAAVAVFAGLLTFLATRDAGWETLAGAQTVTLADGSTVELADNARLQISEDQARQARLLGGEALFQIVRDPENPFEVTTPNAEVTVLGTTFSVDATDVETEVVLVEGAVTLAPRATPDAAVRLEPGQVSRVLALDPPTTPEAANLAALDWTQSIYVADGTPAGEIVRRLADRFDAEVEIETTIAGEPMSAGEYGADGLEAALDLLAAALEAEVLVDGAGYRIVE